MISFNGFELHHQICTKYASWYSHSWCWKWQALTLTYKVIWPFRLTKRHSTLLLNTDLGRPRGATRPKHVLVSTKSFINILFADSCFEEYFTVDRVIIKTKVLSSYIQLTAPDSPLFRAIISISDTYIKHLMHRAFIHFNLVKIGFQIPQSKTLNIAHTLGWAFGFSSTYLKSELCIKNILWGISTSHVRFNSHHI